MSLCRDLRNSVVVSFLFIRSLSYVIPFFIYVFRFVGLLPFFNWFSLSSCIFLSFFHSFIISFILMSVCLGILLGCFLCMYLFA